MELNVTSEWLVITAAAVISLLASYVPGLNVWYAAKPKEDKQLIMVGVIASIVALAFVGQCAGLVQTGLVCTGAGGLDALVIFFIALSVNQGTYKVSPTSEAVRKVRA
jgi:hypothetical protein